MVNKINMGLKCWIELKFVWLLSILKCSAPPLSEEEGAIYLETVLRQSVIDAKTDFVILESKLSNKWLYTLFC